MNNHITDISKMVETCVFCAFWHPEGKLKGIIRSGGKCNLNGTDMRMDDSCWAWRVCSPNQMERRKQAGLIEEAKYESS